MPILERFHATRAAEISCAGTPAFSRQRQMRRVGRRSMSKPRVRSARASRAASRRARRRFAHPDPGDAGIAKRAKPVQHEREWRHLRSPRRVLPRAARRLSVRRNFADECQREMEVLVGQRTAACISDDLRCEVGQRGARLRHRAIARRTSVRRSHGVIDHEGTASRRHAWLESSPGSARAATHIRDG